MQDFIGAVGGPQVRGLQPMAQVGSELLTQDGEFTVRVTVEPIKFGCHGAQNCFSGISRDAEGVFVDIQEHRHLELWSTIRVLSAQIVTEWQLAEAFKLIHDSIVFPEGPKDRNDDTMRTVGPAPTLAVALALALEYGSQTVKRSRRLKVTSIWGGARTTAGPPAVHQLQAR